MDQVEHQTRISFCTIVLNGEPFTRYHFRALYPHAHEIIVVEGACPNSRGNDRGDGHSRDGTLEVLRELKQTEDPADKLRLVTAEDEGFPDGFWPGEKDQMMDAALKRVTGNWVWMVDNDEFYQSETLEWIRSEVLGSDVVDTVSFPVIEFWGSLKVFWDGWRLRQLGNGQVARIFRWGRGYRHVTHRPPTVVDERGIDLRKKGWLRAKTLLTKGHFLFHYGYLFPMQVRNKTRYYSRMGWGCDKMGDWAEKHYMQVGNPFRVDNNYAYPSWLERYDGPHPPQIQLMWDAVASGSNFSDIVARGDADLLVLLASRRYRIGRAMLKHTPSFAVCGMYRTLRYLLRR